MHAAKRALLRAERIIDLTEMTNKSVLTKLILAKCAGEKATIVAFLLEVDEIGAR